MKNLILGLALAMAPYGFMSPVLFMPSHAVAANRSLGDLSAMHAIVADTLVLARAGDLPGAEKRITDFETTWDEAEPTMRPLDTATWTMLDHLSDAAIEALRTDPPSPEVAIAAVDKLLVALDNPTDAALAATPVAFSMVNADGSSVPCEVALEELRRVSATTQPSAADQARFDDLQKKGIERCNADDDKRADNFFAEALAILGQ
jgi:hypothetical protein